MTPACLSSRRLPSPVTTHVHTHTSMVSNTHHGTTRYDSVEAQLRVIPNPRSHGLQIHPVHLSSPWETGVGAHISTLDPGKSPGPYLRSHLLQTSTLCLYIATWCATRYHMSISGNVHPGGRACPPSQCTIAQSAHYVAQLRHVPPTLRRRVKWISTPVCPASVATTPVDPSTDPVWAH